MRTKATEFSFFRCIIGNNLVIIIIIILTAIGLAPGGSGYFTCIQNMKSVTHKFKSGGLYEKHVVATWNIGNHLSAFAYRHRETKKNLCRGDRSQHLPTSSDAVSFF